MTDLTTDEIKTITEFIATIYSNPIEGVQRPEEIEPGVYQYRFQDDAKILEATVNENTGTVSTRIVNPEVIEGDVEDDET